MTWRSGNACCIAIAYGSPGAIVARLRQVEVAAVAYRPVPRRPGCDRSAVACEDRIGRGKLVENPDDVLWRDRVAALVLQFGHLFPPVAHLLLVLLEK